MPVALVLGLTTSCTSEIRQAPKIAATRATEVFSAPEMRREVLSTLETRELRKVVSDLAATAGAAAIDAALRRAAAPSFRPALREVTRTEIAPSMSGLLSTPEVRATLASLAFEMSRQAVVGASKATVELARSNPKKGVISRASAIFSEGGPVAIMGAIVLALIVLALAVSLVRTRSKLARIRHQQAAPS